MSFTTTVTAPPHGRASTSVAGTGRTGVAGFRSGEAPGPPGPIPVVSGFGAVEPARATALRAVLRSGERATTIVFWKDVASERTSEEASEEKPRRFVARGYGVFNACQVNGYTPTTAPTLKEGERLAKAEAFFAALKIRTSYGNDGACYITSLDEIRMPAFGAFRSALGHYGVLFHEAVHATSAV